MDHPEVFYAVALGCALITEAGFLAFRREAFGPLTWVIGAVFLLSYAALFAGGDLPFAQAIFHSIALCVGMTVARGMVGILCAAMFLPMAILGGFEVFGLVNAPTWWWGLFYLACAQLVFLGMGSNLHPVGRALRRWSDTIHQNFSRLAGDCR